MTDLHLRGKEINEENMRQLLAARVYLDVHGRLGDSFALGTVWIEVPITRELLLSILVSLVHGPRT